MLWLHAADLLGVGGGKKGSHFGGQLAPLKSRIFRPASGVKAARKRAGGLALTPLDKAGAQSPLGGQSGAPFWHLLIPPLTHDRRAS